MSAAKKSSAKTTSAPGRARIGRGTRWSDADVKLLTDAVASSATAKAAFEAVAKQLGKSVGTVQQKYYNLQKQSGAPAKRRGRPAGSATRGTTARRSGTTSAPAGSGAFSAPQLRALTIDELVGLASRVKEEVDRRKRELDAAAKLFG